jgi:hypothetical protein
VTAWAESAGTLSSPASGEYYPLLSPFRLWVSAEFIKAL